MGLTVSRKTAKNLAVRRKNERILTVSRKKMLTVKKSDMSGRYLKMVVLKRPSFSLFAQFQA